MHVVGVKRQPLVRKRVEARQILFVVIGLTKLFVDRGAVAALRVFGQKSVAELDLLVRVLLRSFVKCLIRRFFFWVTESLAQVLLSSICSPARIESVRVSELSIGLLCDVPWAFETAGRNRLADIRTAANHMYLFMQLDLMAHPSLTLNLP